MSNKGGDAPIPQTGADSAPVVGGANVVSKIASVEEMVKAGVRPPMSREASVRLAAAKGRVHRNQNHYNSVAAYVKSKQGKRPIRKVLIANNGNAAVKFTRSLRHWCDSTFGDSHVIEIVGIASKEDMEGNSEFLKLVDEVYNVDGGSSNHNYGNVDLLIDIAERAKCSAIWPGWGHASENPALPDGLIDIQDLVRPDSSEESSLNSDDEDMDQFATGEEGDDNQHQLDIETSYSTDDLPNHGGASRTVAFVGPPGHCMRSLGDKINASLVAQSVNVPTIPWNGSHVTLSDERLSEWPIEVLPEEFEECNVTNAEDGLAAAERIGFPVMIKASEGGGGKGIRRVDDGQHFNHAFRQVQGEIPGSPIFVTKLISGARHIEVQLLADAFGTAIALSGRDCSVQRRHQKIIEEAPPIAVPPEIFVKMQDDAVRLAQTVGYVSAGTVEFLYCPEDKHYYFLELNPRLQVEHPCTEAVCKINLPACQLQVAMGIPLHAIPDVRRAFDIPDERSVEPIPNLSECKVKPKGHVIAVRITAEDGDAGFKPGNGELQMLKFPSFANIWGYFSVSPSASLHSFADSQFGHVFSWGRTRDEARDTLDACLKETVIIGEFPNNLNYLQMLINTPVFQKNVYDTAWLDGLIREKVTAEKPNNMLAIVCTTLFIGYKVILERFQTYVDAISKGQVPSRRYLRYNIELELVLNNVKYPITVALCRVGHYVMLMNGKAIFADIDVMQDGGLLACIGGKNYVVYMSENAQGYNVMINGLTVNIEKERDPSLLRTPSPGKLVRYLVPDEGHVKSGQAYAEIEVMKMYMPLVASESGVLRQSKNPGAVVQAGEIIGNLTLDDPSRVQRPSRFEDGFPEWMTYLAGSRKPHHIREKAQTILEAVMDGYDFPEPLFTAYVNDALANFIDALKNPTTPLHEVLTSLSTVSGRIPDKLEKRLRTIIDHAFLSVDSMFYTFPTAEISNEIKRSAAVMRDHDDRTKLYETLMPIIEISEKYRNGHMRQMKNALRAVLLRFLDVENLFNEKNRSKPYEDVILELRSQHRENLSYVVNIIRSHARVASKNKVIDGILTALYDQKYSNVNDEDHKILQDLANLADSDCAVVSLHARQIFLAAQLPSYEKRRFQVATLLQNALNSMGGDAASTLHQLVDTPTSIFSILTGFLFHEDVDIRAAAFEVYVRRAYRPYTLERVGLGRFEGEVVVEWRYILPGTAVPMPVPLGSKSRSNSWSEEDFNKMSTRLTRLRNRRNNEGDYGIGVREGFMICVDSKAKFDNLIPRFFTYIPMKKGTAGLRDSKNVACIVLKGEIFENSDDDDKLGKIFSTLLAENKTTLSDHGVRRVTFIVCRAEKNNKYFTFRECYAYHEDSIYRHIEPGLVNQLEIARMTNYEIRHVPSIEMVHMYFAKGIREDPKKWVERRLFVRMIVRHQDVVPNDASASLRYFLDELERYIIVSMNALDIKVNDAAYSRTCHNHIFLNFLPNLLVDAVQLGSHVKAISLRHLDRLFKLRVSEIELRLNLTTGPDQIQTPVRIFVDCKLGYASAVMVHTYREFSESPIYEPSRSAGETYYETGTAKYSTIGSPAGPLEGQDCATPYKLLDAVEGRRAEAQMRGTTFVDDIPLVFQLALQDRWRDHLALKEVTDIRHKMPETPLVVRRLKFVKAGSDDKAVAAASIANVTETEGSAQSVHSDGQSKSHKEAVTSPLSPGSNREVPRSEDGRASGHSLDSGFANSRTEGHLETALNSVVCRKTERPPNYSNEDYVYPCEPHRNGSGDIADSTSEDACGVIAWEMTMRTPECPEGRDVVVIANDITHRVGSFGIEEGAVFNAASRYARAKKIPRMFLACNSGARIGLSDWAKQRFRVCWVDPDQPASGVKYLYLSEDDYMTMPTDNAVKCTKRETPEGEVHYVIDAVIGESHGMGVENLQGSGLIAGETSRAYDEIFTISMVSFHAVGIGAYLVRLGSRVVQVLDSSILLTGANALNKVLGREVYGSNVQIGGVPIMYRNGVSNLVVSNDFVGISQMLMWLSNVPKVKGGPRPTLSCTWDPVDRPIDVVPTASPSDPRVFLTGYEEENGNSKYFNGGFFDRGTWVEKLEGWANTVIAGHARLGGVAVGVIAVETRTIENLHPADAANPDSRVELRHEAGQVWYPNSAYKTAQALQDFNREELPLFIFANWRGFSGGQRDMFDEVLKYGSYIVDALRSYNQPIFVYIPPNGELRGGAWVVVDPFINSEMMEMYAAEDSRGGILEPSGIVEIKFKRRDIIAAISRLDPVTRDLNAKLKSDEVKNDSKLKNKLQGDLNDRIKQLEPIYHQIAVQYADLHDRPERMLEKNTIRRIVPWRNSRTFFYWRMSLRLLQEDLVAEAISKATGPGAPTTTHLKTAEIRKLMFRELHRMERFGCPNVNNDKARHTWLTSTQDDVVAAMVDVVARESAVGLKQLIGSGGHALDSFLDGLGVDAQQELLQALMRKTTHGRGSAEGYPASPTRHISQSEEGKPISAMPVPASGNEILSTDEGELEDSPNRKLQEVDSREQM
eukprot:Clim_evm41s144 gene=Clim_evmTU41s144